MRHVTYVGGGILGLVALVDVFVRYKAADGAGAGWVTGGRALFGLALLILAVIVITVAAAAAQEEEGDQTLIRRVGRFLFRQRVSVIGLALLSIAFLFVGQTSGQAIDSIRTWGLSSSQSIARLGFGVGAAILLSLVVYESAVRLTQVTRKKLSPAEFKGKRWIAIGAALALAGVVLAWKGPFGWAPVVVGCLVAALGLLDLAKFPDPKTQGLENEKRRDYDERVAEILAVVPLLLFAITGVSAAIDAGLSRGGLSSLSPLGATAILAATAVLMTGERRPSTFVGTSRKAKFWVIASVLASAVLLVAFSSEIGAALLAVLACTAALVYTAWLFRINPPDPPDPKAEWRALSLPMAVAVGVGTLIAVHINVFGSSQTLGTLTLVGFAIAFWLAVLNWLVFKSFCLKPPAGLDGIGIHQLPILTLVLIAWIATGIVSAPTLHEARLTDRTPVLVGRDHEIIPPTPTLSKAFAEWVEAQPELDKGAGGEAGTVPMFLVAAHGGGIRAAYWTALGLDCIVGVSSTGFDDARLSSSDEATSETEREGTCTNARRPAEDQAAAARRIFIASGVSGGAVGLYGYARQLISAHSLEDGSWVDERLGGDFASPIMGWALFHDVTNRWLGLHPDRGGACGFKIGSVCLTADRAAIEEETFDRVWPEGAFDPLLRLTWDMRSSTDPRAQATARTVPLLITNTIVTGGNARGVVTAVNLGAWPSIDAHDPDRGNFDALPLAGTVEVIEAACPTNDLRLSTAAVLGARFPYVSPAGHLSGQCGRASEDEALEADKTSACATVKATVCEMRLVDGGYADNSGLFTIDALWPSLRQLVTKFNRDSPVKIAPVIVELDNHYRARIEAELSAGGEKAETLVPVSTAFGARNSLETYARALAYRLRPPGCTVTVSPGLHPGLMAPLGWELSAGARDDLREGLVRLRPTDVGENRYRATRDLRRLQSWFEGRDQAETGLSPTLSFCIPSEA